MAFLAQHWLAILGVLATLVGTAGLGGMLKTWLDHKRWKRKDTDEVALELVKRLEGRVTKLEGDLERERAACAADLAVHRHRINNQRQMIYSLLHLFEMPATRRRDALTAIRSEIAGMENAEATERAIVSTAPLGPEGRSDD